MKELKDRLNSFKLGESKYVVPASGFALMLLTGLGVLTSIPEAIDTSARLLDSSVAQYLWQNRAALSGVGLVVILLGLYNYVTSLRKKIENLSLLPPTNRNQSALQLRVVDSLYRRLQTANRKKPSYEDVHQLREYLEESLTNSATYLSEELSAILDQKVHCCIKKLDEGTVTVMARSSSSNYRQSSFKKTYDIDKDTGLRNIASGLSKEFLCNDLRALSTSESGYDNENDSWRDFYNAVYYAPIRKKDVPDLSPTDRYWGFICADSKHGRFVDKECRIVMKKYENFLSTVFKLCDDYHSLYLTKVDSIRRDRGENAQPDKIEAD